MLFFYLATSPVIPKCLVKFLDFSLAPFASATYASVSNLRRPSLVIVSSGHRHNNVKVLNDESDFEALASKDGYITICGFGSLLSEESVRSTFPNLVNFRMSRLTGFRRVFTAVGGFFFVHGIANTETEEIASLSVEPCEEEIITVPVFDIKKSEVVPITLDGKPFPNEAVLCSSSSDEEFFKFRCEGSVPSAN